jgi:hypothetical protein
LAFLFCETVSTYAFARRTSSTSATHNINFLFSKILFSNSKTKSNCSLNQHLSSLFNIKSNLLNFKPT